MKTKALELVASVSADRIEFMRLSWAKQWINIYSNGNIGYQGGRKPTDNEKADIRKRIEKAKELLRQEEKQLNQALKLMR